MHSVGSPDQPPVTVRPRRWRHRTPLDLKGRKGSGPPDQQPDCDTAGPAFADPSACMDPLPLAAPWALVSWSLPLGVSVTAVVGRGEEGASTLLLASARERPSIAIRLFIRNSARQTEHLLSMTVWLSPQAAHLASCVHPCVKWAPVQRPQRTGRLQKRAWWRYRWHQPHLRGYGTNGRTSSLWYSSTT